jgi:glycosyltransferase involved in cell wall biosynthesis
LTAGASSKLPHKLLILTYHYPPSSAAGAVRPFHFAKYLGRQGFDVRVLTASVQPAAEPGVVYVRDPASPLVKRSLIGITHMTIRKFLLPFEDSVVWAWPLLQTAERIIAKAPSEWSVLSTFPPVSTHLAAFRLREKYPIRWIADFRDPLAGSPSRRAVADVAGPLSPRVDVFLERMIARHADLLIANTDIVADIWRRKYPRFADKVHPIWNGFDPEEQPEVAPIPARPYKVLLHAGNVYQGRHPGALLDSLDRLIAGGRLDPASLRVQFVGGIVAGTIPNQDVFQRLIELGCVETTGSVSKREAQRLAAQADYLLLIDLNDGLQLPSKLFDYIRIGRPVFALTGNNSPAARILTRSGIPSTLIYPDTSPAAIDEEILRFLHLPTDPVAATAWFDENFSAERRTRQLVQLLQGD